MKTNSQITNDENTVNVDAIAAMLTKPFYTNKEMMKMLDISSKTLKKFMERIK